MSACFGIFHLDGQPVSPEIFQAMDNAMAYWGPHGGGLHVEGPLAIGSRLLRITPEDQHEHQPIISGSLRLVARVRLDNRKSLCKILEISDQSEVPDSQLILAAYCRFGTDCVEHLIGDWSFALWDSVKHTLLIARDASGNTGLYYWRNQKNSLVFSNGIKGILAHVDFIRRPHLLAIAGILSTFTAPEAEDATAYQDVKMLLPGHRIIASPLGINIERWWRPEALPPLEFRNVEACYSEFLSLYEHVVHQCLRANSGSVAATLSGGLDSGSVVALAAPRLAEQSQRLKAYVHAPHFLPTAASAQRIGDEFTLAEATAKYVGNVEPIAIRSEASSILEGIRRSLDIHDSPIHGAGNYYWVCDILDNTHREGGRILLTGQWGNATVSYAGHGNLLPDLKVGRISRVIRAMVAEENGIGFALKHRIVKPLFQSIAPFAFMGRLRRNEIISSNPYSFLHPSLATKLKLEERMRSSGFDSNFSRATHADSPYIQAFRLGLTRSGVVTGNAWMESGAAYGLDIRDPTRDRRLIEFCWRLPDAAFWANGKRRGLIRQGMRDKLPDVVLYCEQKGLQSADILQRMRNEARSIESILTTMAQHPISSEWIDIHRLREMIHRITTKSSQINSNDLRMAQSIARGLSAAMFLTAL